MGTRIEFDEAAVADGQKMYEMELHEEYCCNGDLRIVRVPGGWLYRFWNYKNQSDLPGGVFVPFHGEFEKDDNPF
jgi:hypothetical protein